MWGDLMAIESDALQQIEELRRELHRRLGGCYDPARVAELASISQEFDRLVVAVTRQEWRRGTGEKG